MVAGVSFTANNGPGQQNISIRGVNSSVGNPTVSIYIDEVPLVTTNAYQRPATPLIIDLDRVEVLRGPQGTLYGASSEGGTIRYLSNQPNLNLSLGSFRSEVSGTQHGGVNYDEQAVVNVPLVDGKVALRIAGEYGHDSGYIDRYDLNGNLLQKGVNGSIQEAVHVTAKIDLGADFTITPSLFLQEYSADDSPTFMPDLGLYKQDKQIRETNKDTLIIPMLTVKKGFDFGDLTSVTAYYTRQTNRVTDGTYYNSGRLGPILHRSGIPRPSGGQRQHPCKRTFAGSLQGPVPHLHPGIAAVLTLELAAREVGGQGVLFGPAVDPLRSRHRSRLQQHL